MSLVKANFNEVYLGKEIKLEDEKNYIKLKTVYEKIIQCLKVGIMLLLLLTIIIFVIFNKTDLSRNQDMKIDSMCLQILIPLGAIGTYWCFAYYLHKIAFSLVRRVYFLSYEQHDNLFASKEYAIQWFFSPDLMLSTHYKARYFQLIKGKKEYCDCHNDDYKNRGLCIQCYDSIRLMNKFFVKFSNWLNVIFSVFLCIAILILVMVDMEHKNILYFFFSILIYRLISRTLEIALAFYNDVVQVDSKIFRKKDSEKYLHGWKNSFLRKPARISLAVHSLFELLLTFFLLYLLTFLLFGSSFASNAKINDYISGNSIIEFILYTISVMFFNISYIQYGLTLWNILHVWQVTLSTILIVLSIASYLGYNDDLYERESKFFGNVLPKIENSSFFSALKVIFNEFVGNILVYFSKSSEIKRFHEYAQNITGGAFVKSIDMRDNKGAIEFYSSFEEYKAAIPEGNFDKDSYINCFQIGDTIPEILVGENARLLSEFPSLTCTSMILPFDGKTYSIDLDRKELNEFLGFKIEELSTKDGSWNKKFSERFIHNDTNRQIFFDKFVKVK